MTKMRNMLSYDSEQALVKYVEYAEVLHYLMWNMSPSWSYRGWNKWNKKVADLIREVGTGDWVYDGVTLLCREAVEDGTCAKTFSSDKELCAFAAALADKLRKEDYGRNNGEHMTNAVSYALGCEA